MIQIELNDHLIRARIKEQGITLSEFARRLHVNRTSLYRCLKERRLSSSNRALELAGALDVDPFALWDFSAAKFAELLPLLTRTAREGSWKRNFPAISFIESYLFPNSEWPPKSIGDRYGNRGREWVIVDHMHDPTKAGSDYYGSLVLGSGRESFFDPQVWHFAYREPDTIEPQSWFPFGAVRLLDGNVSLFNYIGEGEESPLPYEGGPIEVQTHFGRTKTEYRVASLHPFVVKVTRQKDPSIPTVGFRYPGPR